MIREFFRLFLPRLTRKERETRESEGRILLVASVHSRTFEFLCASNNDRRRSRMKEALAAVTSSSASTAQKALFGR